MWISSPDSFPTSVFMCFPMPAHLAMNSCVFRLRHNQQIRGMVIPLIPIEMVNNFSGKQLATKHLLNDDTMHVSAIEFDIIAALTGISLGIGITEKRPSFLLIRVK